MASSELHDIELGHTSSLMASSSVLDLAVHSSLVEGLVGRDDGGVA